MFTSKAEVVDVIAKWCKQYQVSFEDVTVLGSSVLLIHGLVSSCNDIDIEIPAHYGAHIAQYLPTNPVPRPFGLIDLRIAGTAFQNPSVRIGSLKVVTVPRLLQFYQCAPRPKDKGKIPALQQALNRSQRAAFRDNEAALRDVF